MIVHGDCLEVLRTMDANSVDAVVTDPPAGIAFMGADWDKDKGGSEQWIAWLSEVMVEYLRVLKLGGHAVVWSLPRTSHWTGTAIERAGFEIRECHVHLFGSGFPKSTNISKAIDKAAGAEREVIGTQRLGGNACVSIKDKGGTYGVNVGTAPAHDVPITAPATPEAKQWDGWGTALKPAHEMWWLARKPFPGPVYRNVLEWGTGALNVDACRVGDSGGTRKETFPNDASVSAYGDGLNGNCAVNRDIGAGRFPANVIVSGDARDALDRQSGANVSRFFTDCTEPFTYCPKAPANEKMFAVSCGGFPEIDDTEAVPSCGLAYYAVVKSTKSLPACPQCGGLGAPSGHPTVKAIKLMEHFVKLVTPPGGTVLDPFAGSGSTLVAAKRLGFGYVGIEQSTEYVEIIKARLAS